jgi:hypothetical protein
MSDDMSPVTLAAAAAEEADAERTEKAEGGM